MSLHVKPIPIHLGTPYSIVGDRLDCIKQKASLWCWAACVEMVIKHCGVSTDEQCQIVEKGLSKKPNPVHGCCSTPCNGACNQALIDDEINRLWLEEYQDLCVIPQGSSIADDLMKIKLSKGHHIEIKYNSIDGDHVVVVWGYSISSSGELWYHYNDPITRTYTSEGCADAPQFCVGASIRASPIGGGASPIRRGHLGMWTATWIISKPLTIRRGLWQLILQYLGIKNPKSWINLVNSSQRYIKNQRRN